MVKELCFIPLDIKYFPFYSSSINPSHLTYLIKRNSNTILNNDTISIYIKFELFRITMPYMFRTFNVMHISYIDKW